MPDAYRTPLSSWRRREAGDRPRIVPPPATVNAALAACCARPRRFIGLNPSRRRLGNAEKWEVAWRACSSITAICAPPPCGGDRRIRRAWRHFRPILVSIHGAANAGCASPSFGDTLESSAASICGGNAAFLGASAQCFRPSLRMERSPVHQSERSIVPPGLLSADG